MNNPFFEPSTLPYGMPPFGEIRDEHYREAFERGMADQLAEISAITRRRDMPTFENTMIPLERSGQLLERVATVFFTLTSADSTDFLRDLEEEIAPQLAAHTDAIKLDSQLYWRIKTLYEQLDALALDAESRYLVERYYIEYTVAGAGLDEDEKAQLKEFNQRLSTLIFGELGQSGAVLFVERRLDGGLGPRRGGEQTQQQTQPQRAAHSLATFFCTR